MSSDAERAAALAKLKARSIQTKAAASEDKLSRILALSEGVVKEHLADIDGKVVVIKTHRSGKSAAKKKFKVLENAMAGASGKKLAGNEALHINQAFRKISAKGRVDGAGTVDDPIDCGNDVDKAAQLLGAGKHVRLKQPAQVATLLGKLRELTLAAVASDSTAPNFDLCKVSVAGTNLFCADTKGIPRIKMPQLKGDAVPGSLADRVPRDDKGRVDGLPAFGAALKAHGIKVTPAIVKASYLRASQEEINGAKVMEGIQRNLNGRKVKPIYVTRDGYIVDGHHRWAALIVGDSADNKMGDVEMPVYVMDMDIGAALDYATAFTKEYGLKAQGFSDAAQAGQATPVPQSKRERQVALDKAIKKLRNTAHVAKVAKKVPSQMSPVTVALSQLLSDNS